MKERICRGAECRIDRCRSLAASGGRRIWFCARRLFRRPRAPFPVAGLHPPSIDPALLRICLAEQTRLAPPRVLKGRQSVFEQASRWRGAFFFFTGRLQRCERSRLSRGHPQGLCPSSPTKPTNSANRQKYKVFFASHWRHDARSSIERVAKTGYERPYHVQRLLLDSFKKQNLVMASTEMGTCG